MAETKIAKEATKKQNDGKPSIGLKAQQQINKNRTRTATIKSHQQQETTAGYEKNGRKIFISPFRNAVKEIETLKKLKETDLSKLKVAKTTNEKN